jgi:hypothetical protein
LSRRAEKRFNKTRIKAHLNQEELRAQRRLYYLSLRSNKRDQILEEKRRVMEKINWTTGWDDEDDDDCNTCHEEVLNCLLSYRDNWSENFTPVIYHLDVLRKLLGREMKNKFGPVSSQMQETPGVIVKNILHTEVHRLLFSLFSMATSRIFNLEVSLLIIREISCILKDLLKFKEALTQVSHAPVVESCLRILEDESCDLICHTNSFTILHNIVESDLNVRQRIIENRNQILRHMNLAVKVYGPGDVVVQNYIRSITVYLSSFVGIVFDKEIVLFDVLDQFFRSTVVSLLGFVRLNDPDVTNNVLNILQKMTKSQLGIDILVSHESRPLLDFLLSLIFICHPRSDIVLLILASLSSENQEFAKSLSEMTPFMESLNQYLGTSQSTVAYILASFCSLGTTTANKLMVFYDKRFRSFIENSLYFGDKETQRSVVELLYAFSEHADLSHLYCVIDMELVEALGEYLFLEDTRTACLVMDVIFNLIKRSLPEQRDAFVQQTASSFGPCIEYAFQSTNEEVAKAAAKLLDFYLTV